MKKSICIAFAGICASICPLKAQNQLSTTSVDPAADSYAIVKMRHKMDSIRQYRPTVAVVLAGGGAKGAAHVGALEYIYELGIPVDMVLGTSMGGLIGGLIAMGYAPATIDSVLVHTDWEIMMSDRIPDENLSFERKQYREKYLVSIPFHYGGLEIDRVKSLFSGAQDSNPSRRMVDNIPDGYVFGYNVNNIINALTTGYQDSLDFTRFPVPYCCVSTDMVSMKAKYWTSGRITDAMRATMSIPGYFRPVRKDGMVHIDGGTRNNFPADMARAMGADFVIGVDLAWPHDGDDLNSLTNILHQGIILMGKEALERNQRLVDVYIHPDVRKSTMMSFDERTIASNIGIGYDSAREHCGELVSIVEKTGKVDRPVLNNRVAINLTQDNVLISEVVYEGMEEGLADRFRRFSSIVSDEKCSRTKIEEELASIYGTRLFDEASYRLEGVQEPFKLVFQCRQGPAHQLGASVRFDSESKVSVALNVGLNKNKLSGPQLDFTSIIGNNPSMDLDLRYVFKPGASVGFDLFTHFINDRMFYGETDIYKLGIQNLEQGYRYWYNRVQLYVSPYTGYHSFLRFGMKYEVTPLSESKYFVDDQGFKSELSSWNNYKWNGFMRVGFSNLDNKYFPRKGFSTHLEYNYMFRDSTGNKSNRYHIIYAAAKGVIPLGSRVALIPDAYFYSTQSADFSSIGKHESPALSDDLTTSYVGGAFEGQLFSYQMPYFGYSAPHANQLSNTSAVLNVFLRFMLPKKFNLSLVAAGYKDFVEMTDNGRIEYGFGNELLSDYSFGCRIGHDTRLGPLMLDIFWSNYEMWGVRFKAGLDF